ncbi:unnamed protein product [Sphagnum balticum]
MEKGESKHEFGMLFHRPKPPRSIISFLRRKNLSLLKEHINAQKEEGGRSISPVRPPSSLKPSQYESNANSPTNRINMSCELVRPFDSPSSSKMRQLDMGMGTDFRNTSPNFRNKKYGQYMRQRVQFKNA